MPEPSTTEPTAVAALCNGQEDASDCDDLGPESCEYNSGIESEVTATRELYPVMCGTCTSTSTNFGHSHHHHHDDDDHEHHHTTTTSTTTTTTTITTTLENCNGKVYPEQCKAGSQSFCYQQTGVSEAFRLACPVL